MICRAKINAEANPKFRHSHPRGGLFLVFWPKIIHIASMIVKRINNVITKVSEINDREIPKRIIACINKNEMLILE